MVFGFTTTIQSVHVTTEVVNLNPAHEGVLDTTLCDKVCQ